METLGRFQILSRLGRGGMAEAFVAELPRETGGPLRVCLKVLLAHHGDDPELVSAFRTEGDIAQLLSHGGIVGIHDQGCETGRWWMSLELVEGCDLRRALAAQRKTGEPIDPDAVVLVADQVARALAYAHEYRMPNDAHAGIVHRDVSPSNILLAKGGVLKLGDFGFAKVAFGERTRTGIVKGKPAYMPPEQAFGRTVDARADLFSLGVTLYECLAGRRPYDGKTDLETQHNAIAGNRPPLAELAPRAPPPFVALIERMIDPEPDRRPESARAVIAHLRAVPTPLQASFTLTKLMRQGRTT